MPKVPVVEIWRNEVKPYTTPTTPPSPPTSPITPTRIEPKAAAKARSKPNPKSTSSPSKCSASASGGRGVGGTGKPWTPEEKLKLFEIVVKTGASKKNFEGQFEGRTASQCYITWYNTVSPAIRRSLGGGEK